jgi:hypothetical protein
MIVQGGYICPRCWAAEELTQVDHGAAVVILHRDSRSPIGIPYNGIPYTDSALSRQPESVKKIHIDLYDPPRLS